jgi:F-type H+-transporting ATPase subunit a
LRPDPSALIDTVRHVSPGVSDSLRVGISPGVSGHGDTFDFAHVLDHLKNSRELEFPGGHIELPQLPAFEVGGITVDLSISKHVFFMLLSGLILVVLAVSVARKNRKTSVPTGIGNLLEVFIVFTRDEIVLPNMGKGGLKYLPFILTTFLFILIMNLIGLIPYGSTSTSNVSVTAALAFVAFIMIQVAAIRAQGWKRYLAHLTGGVHWMLWPIMIPVEILGLFTKPFALCMRLFANMNGGHIVLLSLIGLILLFRSSVVVPVPVLFGVGISMLELFVALLQAYIFTMLTSLFMGFGMQSEHADEPAEHVH